MKKLSNALKLATIAVLLASFPTQSMAQSQAQEMQEPDAQIFLLDIQEIVGAQECQYQTQFSQESSESENFPQGSHMYNVNIVPETGEMPAMQPTQEQQIPQAQAMTCGSSFGANVVKEI